MKRIRPAASRLDSGANSCHEYWRSWSVLAVWQPTAVLPGTMPALPKALPPPPNRQQGEQGVSSLTPAISPLSTPRGRAGRLTDCGRACGTALNESWPFDRRRWARPARHNPLS